MFATLELVVAVRANKTTVHFPPSIPLNTVSD